MSSVGARRSGENEVVGRWRCAAGQHFLRSHGVGARRVISRRPRIGPQLRQRSSGDDGGCARPHALGLEAGASDFVEAGSRRCENRGGRSGGQKVGVVGAVVELRAREVAGQCSLLRWAVRAVVCASAIGSARARPLAQQRKRPDFRAGADPFMVGQYRASTKARKRLALAGRIVRS